MADLFVKDAGKCLFELNLKTVYDQETLSDSKLSVDLEGVADLEVLIEKIKKKFDCDRVHYENDEADLYRVKDVRCCAEEDWEISYTQKAVIFI